MTLHIPMGYSEVINTRMAYKTMILQIPMMYSEIVNTPMAYKTMTLHIPMGYGLKKMILPNQS